jgi:hypothetical protein
VRDWEERMKGGAVREERSPLKEAMDWEECQLRFQVSIG